MYKHFILGITRRIHIPRFEVGDRVEKARRLVAIPERQVVTCLMYVMYYIHSDIKYSEKN